MIESEDASSVAATLAKNLMGVAKNKSSFEKLPDNFWGYYARGHDSKGEFGIGRITALQHMHTLRRRIKDRVYPVSSHWCNTIGNSDN